MANNWYCNVCRAQNSVVDGECQFCECGGLDCKRDNCSGPTCAQCMSAEELEQAREVAKRAAKPLFES